MAKNSLRDALAGGLVHSRNFSNLKLAKISATFAFFNIAILIFAKLLDLFCILGSSSVCVYEGRWLPGNVSSREAFRVAPPGGKLAVYPCEAHREMAGWRGNVRARAISWHLFIACLLARSRARGVKRVEGEG